MTQAPISMARLLAIAWCAVQPLASAACAARKPAAAAADAVPAPENRLPVPLHVTNSNWADVRIYLVRGAMWVRLGLVTTNSTVDFTIPADFIGQSGSVTLVAYPVAGWGAWTSPLTSVTPGDELELVVESFLQYSHLVVR